MTKHFSFESQDEFAFGTEAQGSEGIYNRTLKRALDICIVLLSAPMILPVIAVLWLMIRRDGGSGFFGHKRIGQNGREFRCWKLRSMIVNAEEALQAHLAANPEAAKEWAETRKLRDDPRITRLGNLIRATSLDELPQLWNVFIGEMSIVGPRPVVQSELDHYAGSDRVYLDMRPGVTGHWQVSGRNSVSYAERVALDAEYHAGVSFRKDVQIIAKTVGVVFKRTGW